MQTSIKLLIIGDLHGAMPKIHANLNQIDAIIAPGDFCSDEIRFELKKLFALRKTNPKLSLSDICDEKEILKYETISLENGQKVLNYLNSLNKPVFLVPGNWEPTEYIDAKRKDIKKWQDMLKKVSNLTDVENKKINFKGLNIIGHGSTSAPEPLKEISEDFFEDKEEYEEYKINQKLFSKIYQDLRKLFQYPKISNSPTLLLTHNVPYKTKLDKVNAPGSYAHNKHYGSRIARNLIDEFQPLICIGGHIHEGYGKTRLKKTTCINAGFGGEVNTIIEIDIEKQKITKLEFLGENKN